MTVNGRISDGDLLGELDGYPVDVELGDGRHLAGELEVREDVVRLTPLDGLDGSVAEPLWLAVADLVGVEIMTAAPA